MLRVAGLMVVGLLAVSGAYGFHGDEMYYIVAGQHPAFGYVDQPPLTPGLSAASWHCWEFCYGRALAAGA